MKTPALTIYAVFGGFALLAGTAALIAPSLVTGPDTTPLTSHLIREQAAGFIFIGLMLLWCVRNFDRRRPVHWGMVVFTALFAMIHWADYLQHHRDLVSPLVNTIPVVAFAATAPRAGSIKTT